MQLIKLNQEELVERNRLLHKYESGKLDKNDAVKLKKLLEKEKEYALNIGDLVLATGIVFLLAGLIEYLIREK